MKTWNLNKSTATNGIAAWKDLSGTYVNKVNKNTNQCPKIGEIVTATYSDYKFTYNGFTQLTTNNQLAVYSKCSWASNVFTYIITFKSTVNYSMIYLANTSSLSGSGGMNRMGISMAQSGSPTGSQGSTSWISNQGLSVNDGNSSMGMKSMLPGATVYIFSYSSNRYYQEGSFKLLAQSQTVNF